MSDDLHVPSIPQNAPEPGGMRKKSSRKRDEDESDYEEEYPDSDSVGRQLNDSDELDEPAPLMYSEYAEGGRRSKRARKMSHKAMASQEQAAEFPTSEPEEDEEDDEADY